MNVCSLIYLLELDERTEFHFESTQQKSQNKIPFSMALSGLTKHCSKSRFATEALKLAQITQNRATQCLLVLDCRNIRLKQRCFRSICQTFQRATIFNGCKSEQNKLCSSIATKEL